MSVQVIVVFKHFQQCQPPQPNEIALTSEVMTADSKHQAEDMIRQIEAAAQQSTVWVEFFRCYDR